MPDLPRAATAPKLASLQVALNPVCVLDGQIVRDDELVTELDCARLEIAEVATEFVEFASVALRGGTLAGSRWRRTNWVDVLASDVDANNASFVESGWHRTEWVDSRLTGLTVAGCTLQDVVLRNCRLDLANLRFANLQRVRFENCDLSHADFGNAMLRDVVLRDCTFNSASFSQARVERVLVDGGTLAGITGLDGLRGASVRADQITDLAREMALALGLQMVED